jgi:hypothetical protein
MNLSFWSFRDAIIFSTSTASPMPEYRLDRGRDGEILIA